MIPLFKVYMSEKAKKNVSDVLDSGYIGQGQKVDEFEKALSDRFCVDSVVAVNSCTSALKMALKLAGVGPGDCVISTPMTCSATNIAIAQVGATIIWADIDQYGNIDAESVARSITPTTKAVVAVDWGGMPCDFDEIGKAIYSSDKRGYENIPIIQDAAHAIMSTYKGQHVARATEYTAFSFQAIKHLTTGDGGALVVPLTQYDNAIKMRWYGLDRRVGDRMKRLANLDMIGDKYHMNDIAAAIGLANIEHLDDIVKAHRDNAERYNDVFTKLGIVKEPPTDRQSSYWIYTINVENPYKFIRHMKERGIEASQVHMRNDIYSVFSSSKKPLPNLDKWFQTMVCIPVGWWLSEKDVQRIIDETVKYVRD